MAPFLGVQFDAIEPLPFTPALQAMYINGRWAVRPRYGRGRVYIDVTGSDPRGAFWLDVEKGDASPDRVPGWLDERRAAGNGEGGIYCNRSTMAAVEEAAGTRPHLLWIATLDGTFEIAPVRGVGVLAVIQLIPAAMLGFPADLSVVVDRDYWKHAL